jgi:GT2 family glycosyltransferase
MGPAERRGTARLSERLAVVVVTYNRSGHLEQLLASLAELSPAPWRVVVVDNASTDDTAALLAERQDAWGERLEVLRLASNTGGAGGFSAGVERAHSRGAEWMWLMDDDVAALPDALDRLAPWAARFACVTGRKLDFDGRPFRWQNRFSDFLGVPLPIKGDPFAGSGWFEQTAGNFEGMLIRRDVVERIGLPDPRFFIVWDDAVYGWLAHRATTCAVVDAFVLRRTRVLGQRQLGDRAINATGDRYRFHVMRNRVYVRHYLRHEGALHPFGFALGSLYTFGKEVVRTLVVEHHPGGVLHLLRGVRAGWRIGREPGWEPMPSLDGPRAGAA